MGSEVANAIETELLSVDSLTPYAKNPRTGDVEAIKESLTVNGQYRAIVVRAGTHEVLAGNHTLAAAKALGWSELLCHVVDVDDEQAARIVLVDNRSNDLATYEPDRLIDLLTSLPEVRGTGFSDGDLAALLKTTEVDWSDSLDGIPTGDRDPFRQMTFTLHDQQAETVSDAMRLSKSLGAFDSENENVNGNALARICESFLTQNG